MKRKTNREERYQTRDEEEWAILILAETIKQCPLNKTQLFFKGEELNNENIRHLLGGTIEAEELRFVGELDCRTCWVAKGGYDWICEVLREQEIQH